MVCCNENQRRTSDCLKFYMDYVISVAINAFKIEHLTVCHFRKASLGAATLRIMWKTKLDVIFLVKSVDILSHWHVLCYCNRWLTDAVKHVESNFFGCYSYREVICLLSNKIRWGVYLLLVQPDAVTSADKLDVSFCRYFSVRLWFLLLLQLLDVIFQHQITESSPVFNYRMCLPEQVQVPGSEPDAIVKVLCRSQQMQSLTSQSHILYSATLEVVN